MPSTPTSTDPRDTSTMSFWDELLGGVSAVNDATFSHLSTPPRSGDPSMEEVRRLRAKDRRKPTQQAQPPVRLTNDDAGWATIASEAAQLAILSGQARPRLKPEADEWDKLGDMAHEVAAYDLAGSSTASLAESTQARLDIVKFAAARSVAADQARAVAAQSATTGDELLNRVLALHLQTRGNLEKTGLELAREGWDRGLITPHLLSTIDNRIAEAESTAQTAMNPPPDPAGLADPKPDQEAADTALAGAAALRMVKAQLLRERKLPYLPTGGRKGATLPAGLAQHPRYINIIDSPINRGMAAGIAAEQAAAGTPPERGLLREVANSGVRTIGRFAGAGSAAFETAAQFIARNGGAGTPTPDTLHFAASALELVRGATHRPAFSPSPSIEHLITEDGSISFKAAAIKAGEQTGDLAITIGAGVGAAAITANPAVGVLVGAAVGSGLDTANVVSETIQEQISKGASYEDATVTGQAVGTLYGPISYVTNMVPLEKFLDKSPVGDAARGYLVNAAKRAVTGSGAEVANEVPQAIWQDFSTWAATNDPETWNDWQSRYGEAAVWAAVLGGGANVAMHAPADAGAARQAALGPNPLERIEPAPEPTPAQKLATEALAAGRAPTRAKALQALRNINQLGEAEARVLPTDEYTDQHRRLAALGESLGLDVAFLDGAGKALPIAPAASSRSGTVVLDANETGPAAALEFFQHELVHEAAGRAAERGLTDQWSTLLKAVREADPEAYKAATAGYEAAAKEAGIELDPDQLGEEALATIAQSVAGRVLWGNVSMPDLVRMAERAPTAFQELLSRAKGLLRRIGVPTSPSLAEEIRGRARIARLALELREAGELLRSTAADVPVAGPNVEALALDESEYTPPAEDEAIPLDQPGPTAITQDRREAYRREFRQRQQQAGRPLRNQPPTGIDAAPQDATVPLEVGPDSDLPQTLPVDTAGGIPPQFNPYIAPSAEVQSPIAIPGRQGPGAARITGSAEQAAPRPRLAPQAATGTAQVPPPYPLADGDSSVPPPAPNPARTIQAPGGPNASSVSGSAQPFASSAAIVTGSPSGTSSSRNPGPAGPQALRSGNQASTEGVPPGPPATIRTAKPSDQAGPARTSPARKLRVGGVDRATNRKILQASRDVQQNIELSVQKQPDLDARVAEAIQGIEGATYDKSRTKTAEPGKPVPSTRILEKADPANPAPRPAHTISDYLAARIIVDSPAAMEAATKALREAFATTEFKPDVEDFSVSGKPKKGGYRARGVQVSLGDGFTAEVQLVPRPIYKARKRTHPLYEKMRTPGATDEAVFMAAHEAQKINRAAIEEYLQSLEDTESEPGNRVPSAEVRLTKARVIAEVKKRFSDFATKRLLKLKQQTTVGDRMLEIIEAVPGVDLYSPEYRDDQSRMFALAEYVLRGEGSRLEAKNLVGIDAGKLKVGDTWRIGSTLGARWRFAVIAADDNAIVVRAFKDPAIPGMPESRGYHYILPRDGGLAFGERGTLTRAAAIQPADPELATSPKPVDTRTIDERLADDAARRQAQYARNNARAAEFREGLPDEAEIDPDAIPDQDGTIEPPPDDGIPFALRQAQERATRSPAFNAWFGTSRVVDSANRPLPVYHGTFQSRAFTEFDERYQKGGVAGRGFYFAEKPVIANTFAPENGLAGRVYPAFLRIEKPLDFDEPYQRAEVDAIFGRLREAFPNTILDEAIEATNKILRGQWFVSGFQLHSAMFQSGVQFPQHLKAAGFDGITHLANSHYGDIHLDGDSLASPPKYGRVWVAFDPNQIKGAFNAGTFNSDPDIRFAMRDAQGQEGLFGQGRYNAGGKQGGLFGDTSPAPAPEPEAPARLPGETDAQFAERQRMEAKFEPAKQNTPSMFGEAAELPEMFERKHRLTRPIRGKTGAEIVGYRWMSRIEEGMYRDRRVSDWSNSQISSPTGREIVHLYLVKTPDGAETLMGIGAAKKALGLSEDKLRTIAAREARSQEIRRQQWDSSERGIFKDAKQSPAEANAEYRRINDPYKWMTNKPIGERIDQAAEMFDRAKLLTKDGRYVRTGDTSLQDALLERGWTEHAALNTANPKDATTLFALRSANRDKPRREWFSPGFKRWFGDWENEPEYSSKVKQDDGSPKVMFHGTLKPGFTVFDPAKADKYALYGPGFYFTDNPMVAGGLVDEVGNVRARGYAGPDLKDADNKLAGEQGRDLRRQIVLAILANDFVDSALMNSGYLAIGERGQVTKNLRRFEHGIESDDPARAGTGVPAGQIGFLAELAQQPYNFPIHKILSQFGLHDAGAVYPVHLNIRNPFPIDAELTEAQLRQVEEFVARHGKKIEAEIGFAGQTRDDKITLGVELNKALAAFKNGDGSKWDRLSFRAQQAMRSVAGALQNFDTLSQDTLEDAYRSLDYLGIDPTRYLERSTVAPLKRFKASLWGAERYADPALRARDADKVPAARTKPIGELVLDALRKIPLQLPGITGEYGIGSTEYQTVLKAAGFDGITHTGGRLVGGHGDHTVYIAFHPEQVKSAIGGAQHYDDATADIHYALRQAQQRAASSPAFKAWFGASKVVDAEGLPLPVYHGARRPDRIGTRFLKSRATSGPMPFFTDDPAIASGYAQNKADTSHEPPASYGEWFKVRVKGQKQPIALEQLWYRLTPEERAEVADRLPRVTNHTPDGDEMQGFRLGGPDERGLSDKQHWDYTIRREGRGNVLKAAVDIWLNSGALFDQEAEFLNVLNTANVPALAGVELHDPYAEHPAVLPMFLAITNPLDTAAIPDTAIKALEQASRRQRRPVQENGADPWDKRARDPRAWYQSLLEDQAAGTTHAWTSIPDWVTATLRGLGYDGVKDAGGKYHAGRHNVWVPFEPRQIKSAFNSGEFSRKPDIRFALRTAGDLKNPAVRKAFNAWFKGSEVVNPDGSPMEVYHATNQAGFTEFRVNGWGKTEGAGAFFSSSRQIAETYVRGLGEDVDLSEDDNGDIPKQRAVYRVYLSIKQPWVIDARGQNWDNIVEQPYIVREAAEPNDPVEWFETRAEAERFIEDNPSDNYEIFEDTWGLTIDQLARDARRAGADGLIVHNVVDEGPEGTGHADPATVYVAFAPNQIKSSDQNFGKFSAGNNDIRHALRNITGADLDNFTRQVPRALAEQPPRQIGRPDLANPGLTEPQRRVVDAADQVRPQPEALADRIVAERSADRLARNAEAERRALLTRVDRGDLLDVADVAVAQELVRRAADRVLAEGSREAHLEAIKLHEAYRQSGTDAARAFRMRRDRMMSPAERARQFLAAAIAEPTQGDRARIDRIRRRLRDQDHPPTAEREGQLRQQLERIYERAADQAERIQRDVAAAGFDPANITDELLDQPREAARLIRTVAAARATLGDKITEYWINSILSAPTTQAANIIGNAAFGAYEFLGRRLIEGGLNQLAGDRADTSAARLTEYTAIARALEPGLRLAARNFLEAYATEVPVLSRQVGGPDASRLDTGNRTAIRGRLGRGVRALGGRPLMAFDEAFRSLWATMDAHARAHRQAFGAERLTGAAGWERVRSLVADMHSPVWEQALGTATHLAFQDRPTALGRAALAARREFNAAARVPLATFILPFITTPDRILAAGLKLTPLVGIKTIADAAQGRLDWRNRGHIAQALAENIIAWGLFLGIKAIADNRDDEDRPLITGSTPGQRGARELAYRTAPPMSIRIGDKYVSYSRIEPFATALGLIVDATQAPADAGELYEQAITTLKNQLQDKTFLKGLSDIMAIVDQPSSSEGKALSMAQHIATGFVPNIAQAAQRSADSTLRDRAIRGSDARGMASTAVRRGLEQAAPAVFTPPPRVDLWGRDVDARQAGTGLSDFAYRFTVPIRLTDIDRATKLDLLINRYNTGVPDADRFLPEAPRPTIQRTVKGERVSFRLSDAEFVRYQREAGRMAAERLAGMTLNHDKPTERDIERIKKALEESRRRVADQIVRERASP